MPKGNSFERAFKIEVMLKRGVTVREVMKEFGIKKPSAQRMIDVMSSIKNVYEAGKNRRGAIIYRVKQ